MSYHHSQGSHEASWSHNGSDSQEVIRSSLPSTSSNGHEQAFEATSPLSEPQTYGQGWNHGMATYSQEPLYYYPYHTYQRPSTAGHNTCGTSNFTTSSNAAAGSQKNLEGNYMSSHAYPRSYEYVCRIGKNGVLLTYLQVWTLSSQ